MPYKDPEKKKEARKKWNKENPEKVRESKKRRHEKNKNNPEYREKRKEARKRYRKNNPEKEKERENKRKKRRYEDNPKYREGMIERAKLWKINNPEKVKESRKSYIEKNRKEITTKHIAYVKRRKETDAGFRMLLNIRKRQNEVMKGMMSTTKGLGCDSQFLRLYIENLWEPWMNWDNYGIKEGQWSIDHIIALSSFEMDGEGNWNPNSEYNKKLIHYTNLRPLLHKENMEKSNKVLDIY